MVRRGVFRITHPSIKQSATSCCKHSFKQVENADSSVFRVTNQNEWQEVAVVLPIAKFDNLEVLEWLV